MRPHFLTAMTCALSLALPLSAQADSPKAKEKDKAGVTAHITVGDAPPPVVYVPDSVPPAAPPVYVAPPPVYVTPAPAYTPAPPPPSRHLKKREVRHILQNAGYRRVHDLDRDDGVWRAKAVNRYGQRVTLRYDPHTGQLTERLRPQRRDDDDDDDDDDD